MAKLIFKTEKFDDLEYKIIVTITKDLNIEEVKDTLKSVFPLEMHLAEIVEKDEVIQISFTTMQIKLVEIIEDRIYQYMRSENRKIPLVKMQILSREVISEETLTKNALTNY